MPRVISGTNSLAVQHNEKPAWNCRIASYNNDTNFTSGEVITNYSTSSNNHFVYGGCAFDSSNGLITVPVSGLYFVGVGMRYDFFGGSYFYIDIQQNGATFNRFLQADTHSYNHGNVFNVRRANAGDTFRLVATSSGDTTVGINDDSYFVGHMIDG